MIHPELGKGDGRGPELPEIFGLDDSGISKQVREEEGCRMGGSAGRAPSPELALESWPHNLLIMGPWTRYFNYVAPPFPTLGVGHVQYSVGVPCKCPLGLSLELILQKSELFGQGRQGDHEFNLGHNGFEI